MSYYLPVYYQKFRLMYSSLRNYIAFRKQKKYYMNKLRTSEEHSDKPQMYCNYHHYHNVFDVFDVFDVFEANNAHAQASYLKSIIVAHTLPTPGHILETKSVMSSKDFVLNASKLGIFGLVMYYCKKYVCGIDIFDEIYKGICSGCADGTKSGLLRLLGKFIPCLLVLYSKSSRDDVYKPKNPIDEKIMKELKEGDFYRKPDDHTIAGNWQRMLCLCLSYAYIGYDECDGCDGIPHGDDITEGELRWSSTHGLITSVGQEPHIDGVGGIGFHVQVRCFHCLLISTINKYITDQIDISSLLVGDTDECHWHSKTIAYAVETGLLDRCGDVPISMMCFVIKKCGKFYETLWNFWKMDDEPMNVIIRNLITMIYVTLSIGKVWVLESVGEMIRKKGLNWPDTIVTHGHFENFTIMKKYLRYSGSKISINSTIPERNITLFTLNGIKIKNLGNNKNIRDCGDSRLLVDFIRNTQMKKITLTQ
jgi:hypothetical protein